MLWYPYIYIYMKSIVHLYTLPRNLSCKHRRWEVSDQHMSLVSLFIGAYCPWCWNPLFMLFYITTRSHCLNTYEKPSLSSSEPTFYELHICIVYISPLGAFRCRGIKDNVMFVRGWFQSVIGNLPLKMFVFGREFYIWKHLKLYTL